MPAVNIAIIGRETLLIESLAESLENRAAIRVLWTAGGPRNVPSEEQCCPDVLLADIDTSLRDAKELLQKWDDAEQSPKMIGLSQDASEGALSRALGLGAQGYVLKADSLETLVSAIRTVSEGQVYRTAAVSRTENSSAPASTSNGHSRKHGLTAHQIEIVRHLARGASAKEVASLMHLSVKTISTHKYRIMRLLRIHDRVQLAWYAIREGLVSP